MVCVETAYLCDTNKIAKSLLHARLNGINKGITYSVKPNAFHSSRAENHFTSHDWQPCDKRLSLIHNDIKLNFFMLEFTAL